MRARRREPLVEHRLELDGFATRALELEGDGPPLLLLHGYADSADTWRRLLDRLGARGRRALAVDLPGFGAADPLRPGEPVLEQLDRFAAAALRLLIEESGGEPAIVAGNSLGGCLALRAAQQAGDELRAIAPIAPAGLDMPSWFGVIERDPVLRWLLASPVPLPGAVVRAVVGEVYRQLAFARPREAAREVVEAFTAHHADPRTVARILDTGRRLLPELADPFRLEEISVPVLLIWGDRDRMVPHRGARRVLDAQPDTEVVLLEGVGHCPQVEAAERVDALLQGLCARSGDT
ncbi:MAG TPA: alpha/beta fold hydrolase [Capillimicrobium sp.]|nr:alpha/beta fold hydrolase [Capillimicrobium sp.]